MNSSKSFIYFAYGSNLLTRRIQINNPSATRIGIGKLTNYHLDFITYSTRWRGASATIVPRDGHHVWGALWEIDITHLPNLDHQEGVADKIYFPLEVDVELPDGSIRLCRVYQQHATPTPVPTLEHLPSDRRPSVVYLNTILRGAEESDLPHDYIGFLKQIPHNGYDGNVDLFVELFENS